MAKLEEHPSDPEPRFDFEEASAESADECEIDTDATVTCPYCGERCELTLDPDGGASQQYVEDCPVCCRPWSVHVDYNDDGSAEAWVEESG